MIQINEKSTTPIYQQVYDELLNLIVLKVISEHEKLPSVRELALSLQINPNTIQRAYKALENDGFVYSQPGKGNFVKGKEHVTSLYKESLKTTLKEVIGTWLNYGVSKDEIHKAVEEILKEKKYVKN